MNNYIINYEPAGHGNSWHVYRNNYSWDRFSSFEEAVKRYPNAKVDKTSYRLYLDLINSLAETRFADPVG